VKLAAPYDFDIEFNGYFTVKDLLEPLYGLFVGVDQLPSQLLEVTMNFNHFTEMPDGELGSETL
jgi:hypothetical protein